MATQVYDGLFVGNGCDTYKFAGSILHCAKNPWFDDAAANIRLLENSAPPIERGIFPSLVNGNVILVEYNEMALNMVDVADPSYFSHEMVNSGLQFISDRMADGDPVLVHCNMGVSRSPSMAFLWMFEHGLFADESGVLIEYRYAKDDFEGLYPDWYPGNGIRAYLDKRCQPPEEESAANFLKHSLPKITPSDPRGWFIDDSFGEED